MFMILLTLTASKTETAEHMEGHRAWIRRGVTEGLFVMVGSLRGGRGGGIIVRHGDRAEITARVAADPFVEHGVAQAKIIELNATGWDIEYDETAEHLRWSTAVNDPAI